MSPDSSFTHDKSFAERALLRDLESLGFPLDSVWQWVNSSGIPPSAVPVLLDHFDRTTDERLAEGIARALTERGNERAVPHLLRKFPDLESEHVRWAIAHAVAFLGFRGHEDAVLQIVSESRFGTSRSPLVERLHRVKQPSIEDLLLGLLEDASVAPFAAASLARCGTARALPRLRALAAADAQDKLAKKYFQRAVEKIESRSGPSV